MTSSTYSHLMSSLNAPEGSEMYDRLQKLQELEQLRKEREVARQQRRQQARENGSTNVRFMRTRSTNRDNDTSYTAPSTSSYSSGFRRGVSRDLDKFNPFVDSSSQNDYGARPKHSGSSNSGESEDLADIFSSITSDIVGRNRYGSDTSSSTYTSSRRRPVLEDYRSSSFQNDKPYRSDRSQRSGQPNYTRSISDNQTGRMFGESSEEGQYGSRARRRAAQTHATDYNDENGTEHDRYNEYNTNEDGYQVVTETVEYHDDVNDYEEGEEPKHFIERLKNGSPVQSKRGVDNDYIISTIPSIPPIKKQRPLQSDDDPLDEDIVAVAKDIRATFGIRSPKSGDSQTSEKQFGFGSNKENLNVSSNTNGDFVFSAKTGDDKLSKQSSSKRKSRQRSLRNSRENLNNDKNSSHMITSENNENVDESVIYEITEVQDDSDDDDEGKQLPISDAFNKSGWIQDDNTPGKLDKMHEYFTGEALTDDPVIDRVLDGRGVKKDLEKSFKDIDKGRSNYTSRVKSPEQQKGAFSSLKSAFNNLVEFNSNESKKAVSSSDSTPEKESEKITNKEKRTSAKTTPKTSEKSKNVLNSHNKRRDSGKHKALEKVKAINKSSDSDNDSFQTASESESDYKTSRKTSGASTPTKNVTEASKHDGKAAQANSDMSLTLSDKLARLETMTQEKKRKQSASESEGKRPVPSYMSGTNASQSKSRAKSPAGLAKDVRELKKFVHEHTSEPSTPVHSSRKEMTDWEKTPTRTIVMKEIATQTNMKINDALSQVYVCIHCGKSSDQKVDSSVSDATTDGEDTESLDRYETRSETGYNLRSATSKTSQKSSTQKWTFGKNEKRKAPSGSKSYMKGTTSSSLKTNITDSAEKVRKTSVPDFIYNSKLEETGKAKKGKSIVAQRAKDLEIASKKGEQKRMAFSAQRASSTDRNKIVSDNLSNEKSKLGKSKSVEQMYFVKSKPERAVEIDIEKPDKDINSNDIQKSPESKDIDINKETLSSPGEKRTRSQMLHKSPEREKQSFAKVNSGTPEKSQDEKFASSKARKPPAVSPKPKRLVEDASIPKSPTKSDEVFETAVESKGQFTRLENNPFIRNDLQRRNSLKDRKDCESVWEKSESRSTSSVEGGSPQRDSSLKRSNTSAGEKSSLTNLHWSDSGSSESLHASRSSRHGSRSSSLHGSFESLNRSPQRPRSSSTTSNTSQNAMLNLLSPIGTVRHPLTGALETDVDAAFDNVDNTKSVRKDSVEHNEETVDRTHLDFAKKACDLLEFDTKKRDSSSDSQNGAKLKNNAVTNGHGGESQSSSVYDKNAKKGKDKQKRGFFKGKMFKK